MNLIFRQIHKSLTTSPVDGEIEDFIVLSGPNGSGKSSLLEAIAEGKIAVEGVFFNPQDPTSTTNIRMFVLSQFVVPPEGAQSVNNYTGSWVALKSSVDGYMQQLRDQQSRQGGIFTPEQTYEQVKLWLTQGNQITATKLAEAEESAGRKITEFQNNDYRTHLSRIFIPKNAFELGINEIFLSYHAKRNANQYSQFLVREKNHTYLSPLSDVDFEAKYGPAPWDLFDETLSLVGLSNYKFVSPEGIEDDLSYTPSLTDTATGTIISVNDLSSGEKTLLAVAMTLYTGTNHTDDLKLPRVLLLDEADASLHPSMIVSLLKVIREILVDKFHIKVILTTHSPTTLALAPEEALYIMTRNQSPRLRKALSKDEALKVVTVGLPTLSVKFDNRVQVFVEAEEDAHCYDAIYNLISHEMNSEKSLSFIASGRGGAGNVGAVLHLVSKLNDAGNATVKGFIDRDDRDSSPSNIYYSVERYSLENHILDPLAVGVYLLRERIISAQAMGFPRGILHTEAVNDGQKIIDFVISKIQQDEDDAEPVNAKYHKGATYNIPKWFTDINGHELQQRYTSAFRQFIPLDRDKKLLIEVIQKAMYDVTSTIPQAILDVFKRLLEE